MTQCFMVRDSHRVQMELRRFVFSSKASCPGRMGYHNARVGLGECAEVLTDEGYLQDLTKTYSHDDPRWPTKCDGCVYVFSAEDLWQANQHTLWAADDGATWIDRDLPGGAIREAWWLSDADRGPDGKAYLLRLPAGGIDWSVYGPASDQRPGGPGWTITGTLPNITAAPSINATGVWHGWLNNGILTP